MTDEESVDMITTEMKLPARVMVHKPRWLRSLSGIATAVENGWYTVQLESGGNIKTRRKHLLKEE